MGLSFSNIYIKKNEQFSSETLLKMLKRQMTEKGLVERQNADEAEIEIRVYNPEGSAWVTVASDYYNFGDAESTKAAAMPFSEKFGTDVIAAACVDSDFLMMNLINSKKGLDGWINAGNFYGSKPRRTSLAPWKNVVSDYEKFSEIIKKENVFAEDALYESAELLGMTAEQCALQPDSEAKSGKASLAALYFSSNGSEKKELPSLRINCFPLTPCKFGFNQVVFVNNLGGWSKGVAVMFWGGFVENDDLIIENVTFESDYGSDRRKAVPITLRKRKCANGETVLYWEDKNFNIPKAVDPSVPLMKKMKLEFEKAFGVRFFVSGNPRKLLDVKVSIIPLENFQKGSDTWFVYKLAKSKRAYIEQYNSTWNGDSNMQLNPDDFDL